MMSLKHGSSPFDILVHEIQFMFASAVHIDKKQWRRSDTLCSPPLTSECNALTLGSCPHSVETGLIDG